MDFAYCWIYRKEGLLPKWLPCLVISEILFTSDKNRETFTKLQENLENINQEKCFNTNPATFLSCISHLVARGSFDCMVTIKNPLFRPSSCTKYPLSPAALAPFSGTTICAGEFGPNERFPTGLNGS